MHSFGLHLTSMLIPSMNPLHGVEGVTRQTETDICGMNGSPSHGVGKEMVQG